MDLSGQRLRTSRERAALTQEQVGSRLDVPRELVSMWETEARSPTHHQIEALAKLLHVSPDYLTGTAERDTEVERRIIYSRLPADESMIHPVRQWLDFLDRWADFLEVTRASIPGPGKPPRSLDHGSPVTDARRAPTLADEVRDHYRLGRNALPDMRAFLDERGVLIYRAALGRLEQTKAGVAGVFFNHSRLGFCAMVNTDTSPGRQAFSLAHLYAHALYHYGERGAVCHFQDDTSLERFADTFAPHFLVPRKRLRKMVGVVSDDSVDAYAAVYLARYFRVSYPTILHRLLTERHINKEDYGRMKEYSPSAIAEKIGIRADHFRAADPAPLSLDRYPMSVLKLVRAALQKEMTGISEVAGLLDVPAEIIKDVLLVDPPSASRREMREFYELPG